VTGATGLVGSWLVRGLIDAGADIVCLVRDSVPQSEFVRSGLDRKVRVVRGDLCDERLVQRALAEYEVRTVFHLGAQTIVGVANREPVGTLQASLVTEIVFASSDKAYGDHDVLPYDEGAPLQGRYPYDVSKSCADLIAQMYARAFGLPIVITRCGNFFGGGDLNWNRLVPGTIRSLLRGTAPVIRSDGSYVRDYFYVKDGAAVYMQLAEALAARPDLRGQAFNFSYERQVTVTELVQMISALIEPRIDPVVLDEASNEIRRQYLSAEKARQTLGWKPLYTLEDGLSETVAWYRGLLGAQA
jgi:CDP-glucose 4,6-dehydratase